MTSFIAGREGLWRIEKINPIAGESLNIAPRLAVIERAAISPSERDTWMLRGTINDARPPDQIGAIEYTEEQAGLGRPDAIYAALIATKHNDFWWGLEPGDQRKTALPGPAHLIDRGLKHLPGVAQRLYYGRDLGEEFDFLAWFEYGPEHRDDFEIFAQEFQRGLGWCLADRVVNIGLSRIS